MHLRHVCLQLWCSGAYGVLARCQRKSVCGADEGMGNEFLCTGRQPGVDMGMYMAGAGSWKYTFDRLAPGCHVDGRVLP